MHFFLPNLQKLPEDVLAKSDIIPQKVHYENIVLSIIPTEISIMGRNMQNKILVPKNWILAPKTSRKHNVQKWTLFSYIFNSFRDMNNSLNSPVSHVIKITSQILVYLEI